MKKLMYIVLLAAALTGCQTASRQTDIQAHQTHCDFMAFNLKTHGKAFALDEMTLLDHWILDNICSKDLKAALAE